MGAKRLAVALCLALCQGAAAGAADAAGTAARICLPAPAPVPTRLAAIEQALRRLLEQGPYRDYFAAVVAEENPRFCADLVTVECRGYYEPETNVIAIGGSPGVAEIVLVLAHEIRHLDQASRGFGPRLDVDLSESVRETYALEADAQAITTLVAWAFGEAGEADIWTALEGCETCVDIAAAFAASMAAGGTPREATLAAFTSWCLSADRLDLYRRASTSFYLDRLDETKALRSYEPLPADRFDMLCLMPDGSDYGCQPNWEIRSLD